jgi:hypothetical protein
MVLVRVDIHSSHKTEMRYKWPNKSLQATWDGVFRRRRGACCPNHFGDGGARLSQPQHVGRPPNPWNFVAHLLSGLLRVGHPRSVPFGQHAPRLWRTGQFRYRGGRHPPRVPELWTLDGIACEYLWTTLSKESYESQTYVHSRSLHRFGVGSRLTAPTHSELQDSSPQHTNSHREELPAFSERYD